MPAGTGVTPLQASPLEPQRLEFILHGDGLASYVDRVRALRAQQWFTREELDAFTRFLLKPEITSPDKEGEHWLRNEMLDAMVQQPTVPDNLADLLLTIYQNRNQDAVMRDYSLQHMVPAYQHVSDQERASFRKILWEALAETDTSIAGTALLALMDISQLDPAIDKARIASVAASLTADDGCCELARITAVQVCGRLKVERAALDVMRLAEKATDTPLRLAATAALADYGSPSAFNLLVKLEQSEDPRQVLAVQSALRRISRSQIRP